MHQNLLEAIGDTPLVRLNRIARGLKPEIFAKVEYLNPGGSVKDRMALQMVLDAENGGLLKKGQTIVEPTSGNTGAGLALVAAIRGYKAVFVLPDKVSAEKIDLLKAYGAEVVITPTSAGRDDPESYYKVAERIALERKGFQPNQYVNPSNPKAHFLTTGPEIWKQTSGKITHLVASMGTGGTICGAGRFLKQKNPKIQIVGSDPEGSVYSAKDPDDPKQIHQYLVEGIGEDFYPKTMDLELVDRIIQTHDAQTFAMTRRLAREEGLLVGGSSGSAVCAAVELAKDLDEKALVVVILPDGGRGYLSKIFSDAWMRQKGFKV